MKSDNDKLEFGEICINKMSQNNEASIISGRFISILIRYFFNQTNS